MTSRWGARWAAVATLAVVLLAGQPQPAGAAPPPTLIVRTMPPIPDAPIVFDGKKLRTGPDGSLRIAPGDWTGLRRRFQVPRVWREGSRHRFSRWIGRVDLTHPPSTDVEITAAFDVDYPVRFRFVDPDGRPVPYDSISRVELRSATGAVVNVTGRRLRKPLLLWGSRSVTLHAGPQQKDIYYRLHTVRMRGANVVNQAQQRYVPSVDRTVDVQLLFFDARAVVRDALFGFSTGAAVRVRYPDGSRERHRLDPEKATTIRSLPRGQYDLTVEGFGLPISSPVAITRHQTIQLRFVTWLDLVVGLLAVLMFLIGLPLLGRRMRRRPSQPPADRREPRPDKADPILERRR